MTETYRTSDGLGDTERKMIETAADSALSLSAKVLDTLMQTVTDKHRSSKAAETARTLTGTVARLARTLDDAPLPGQR